jgi:hypothetical protein
MTIMSSELAFILFFLLMINGFGFIIFGHKIKDNKKLRIFFPILAFICFILAIIMIALIGIEGY